MRIVEWPAPICNDASLWQPAGPEGICGGAQDLPWPGAERAGNLFTLRNTLGFLDNAENRLGQARKEVSEALKIYRDLAQKDPEPYLAHVAITLNNLGVFDKDQNQLNEARKEYEEALKIYHELAEKEPETYLSYVAATLNNLGILDYAQNQLEETRKAFEEALNIYESLAKQDPDQFSPLVEQMKKLLKHLPN